MSSQPNEVTPNEGALERSTYEIIRNRLTAHSADLRERLTQLNTARRDVFGAIETELLATEHITTENNCVPRDMVSACDHFIFGYNVRIGLRSETRLSDVLAIHNYRDGSLRQQSLEVIHDSDFERDFKQLYKYYKHTNFSRFHIAQPYIYMVFQVGATTADIKAFKWLTDGDQLKYIDARSDHEVAYPSQHEFEWRRTHRDLHRGGLHPHISVEDRIFVETVGGDLTIKVEDNTDVGEGIYSEPVDDPDQTLDDADIFYACVENIILLKIRPYQESAFRYIVYNDKIKTAHRCDALADACVLLPQGHGLILSNGYFLQTGEHKSFDNDLADLRFLRRLTAPNGEDYLYVFFNPNTGTYVLLSYNVIEQCVDTPIVCHGYSMFENRQLLLFRAGDDPQKHHALQVWQTPYVANDINPHIDSESMLFKIGNQDLVRGMAECSELLQLAEKDDAYADLYVDLVKKATDILDGYFWIDTQEACQLGEPLKQIKETAGAAIDEFEKMVRARRHTRQQFEAATQEAREIAREIKSRRFEAIDDYVQSLADLRRVRGNIIGLRELRYIDLPAVDEIEQEVALESARLSHHCVEFLLRENSLAPYEVAVRRQRDQLVELTKVAAAKQLGEEIAVSAAELEMLIDTVSNLKIDDDAQRTEIIDSISAIYSLVNQVRASLKTKTRELLSVEGEAEFHSQMKLLSHAVMNYLDVCDTPQRCDEYLTKVMVQIEELEGRFAEFDDFILQLAEKRDEIYSAFDSRKVAMVEARNKRATSLLSAAHRIIKGIETRVGGIEDVGEIHSYFAADVMVEKVRDIVEQLDDLGDSVKVDEIQGRLKTAREDAVRQLKDRQELFVDGTNAIQLGRHTFTVNTQPLDLTTVPRDGQMFFHLTGTNFMEEIRDEEFLATRNVWDQVSPAENEQVYRAEYLAYQLVRDWESPGNSQPEEWSGWSLEKIAVEVRQVMARDTRKVTSRVFTITTQLASCEGCWTIGLRRDFCDIQPKPGRWPVSSS